MRGHTIDTLIGRIRDGRVERRLYENLVIGDGPIEPTDDYTFTQSFAALDYCNYCMLPWHRTLLGEVREHWPDAKHSHLRVGPRVGVIAEGEE